MERELVAVGMNLKTLEVHEERALQRENSFSDHIQSLQNRIKEVKMVKILGSALSKISQPITQLKVVELAKINMGENKIVELEEELRVVGNNLKSLEVSEEKALQREDSYEEQIRTVSARLKEAETRAEFAERSVQKLQKEVDRLEDELLVEKERVHNLTEEIEQTVQEIQTS
uniref:Myosin_tail_1 domain-containing protein n=1 Tax=Elaeophora elaphi TaxID=1147741 RepID=A0A0R3RMJ5_9BILA